MCKCRAEVAGNYLTHLAPGDGIVDARLEGPVTYADENRNRIGGRVGYREIDVAIVIKISGYGSEWAGSRCERNARCENRRRRGAKQAARQKNDEQLQPRGHAEF